MEREVLGRNQQVILRIHPIGDATPAEQSCLLLMIRKVYTLAWLMDQGRIADATVYERTGDPRFEGESGLITSGPASEGDTNPVIVLEAPFQNNPKLFDVVIDFLGAISPRGSNKTRLGLLNKFHHFN